jgi:hypothetical protein
MSIAMTIAINPVFAQTWIEADNEGNGRIEYTVITEAQCNRLLRQFETNKMYAMFSFVDMLLEKPNPLKIISGSKPIFNGYYYLLMKITIDHSKITNDEGMYADMAEGEYLIYGNKNTGELTISFPDSFTAMLVKAFSPGSIADINSDDYKQKTKLFFSLVKEE